MSESFSYQLHHPKHHCANRWSKLGRDKFLLFNIDQLQKWTELLTFKPLTGLFPIKGTNEKHIFYR